MTEIIPILIFASVVAFFTLGAFQIHPLAGLLIIVICFGFWLTVLGALGILG